MARKKTVEIEVVADTSKATRGIKDVGDTAEKQGSKFQTMGTKAKLGFGAAAVGIGATVDFLKDAVVAAAEDEKSQDLLRVALENTVGATDDQIAATEEQIDTLARASGVADDELRPALAELARTTGDLNKANDYLAVAMDIAAAKGKPLQTVVDAIGKSAANNTVGQLGRLGLKTRDAAGDMLSLDEVMQEAQRTMGGAMETAAESGAGSLARLQVAVGEAMEEIGTVALPLVVAAADAVIEELNNLQTAGDQSFFDEVLGDFQAFADWAQDPHIMAIADFFGIDLPTAVDETVSSIDKVGPAARDAMTEVIPTLDAMEGASDDLRGSVEDTTDAFYDQRDAIRTMHDPVFALAEAQRELDEATAEAAEAGKGQKNGTPEHVAALENVRLKALAVETAQRAMSDQTGVTAETMRTHLRSLRVFTEEQINLMIAAYERNNAFVLRVPRSVSSVRSGTGGGPQAHSGGTVQGAFRGQEVPILARVGEHVSQGGRPVNGNGHGGTTNIYVTALDPQAAAKAVVQALQAYQRSNGAIPINTR